MPHHKITSVAAALALAAAASAQSVQIPVEDLSLPHSTNLIPGNRSFDAPFIIDDNTLPRFQVFDEKFKQILGSSPTIHSISKPADDSFHAFHEAPLVRGDLVYFSSNAGKGGSGPDQNNRLLHVNLTEVEKLQGDGNITVTFSNPSDQIQMINGMQPYLNNSIIMATEGREKANIKPGLFRYELDTNTTTPLLTSYYGRVSKGFSARQLLTRYQSFNSLNDLKVGFQ